MTESQNLRILIFPVRCQTRSHGKNDRMTKFLGSFGLTKKFWALIFFVSCRTRPYGKNDKMTKFSGKSKPTRKFGHFVLFLIRCRTRPYGKNHRMPKFPNESKPIGKLKVLLFLFIMYSCAKLYGKFGWYEQS